MEGALSISADQTQRLLTRVCRTARRDPGEDFPDVAFVDKMIYGENEPVESRPFFKSRQARISTLTFFAKNLSYGFFKDEKWHQQNPGKEAATAGNLYAYLMTPCDEKGDFTPHVGIWHESDSEERREDIQASFEYMQGFLIDKEYFKIDPPKNPKEAI